MKKLFFLVILISCLFLSSFARADILLVKNADTGKIFTLNLENGKLQDTGRQNYLKMSPDGNFGIYREGEGKVILLDKKTEKKKEIFSGFLVDSFLWIDNNRIAISASRLRLGITKPKNVYEDILPTQIWLYEVSFGTLRQITSISDKEDGVFPAVVMDAFPSGRILARPTAINYFEGIETSVISPEGKIIKSKCCMSVDAKFILKDRIIYSKVIYRKIGNRVDLNGRQGPALFIKHLSPRSGKEKRIYFYPQTGSDKMQSITSLILSPDKEWAGFSLTDFENTKIFIIDKNGNRLRSCAEMQGVYEVLLWVKDSTDIPVI